MRAIALAQAAKEARELDAKLAKPKRSISVKYKVLFPAGPFAFFLFICAQLFWRRALGKPAFDSCAP
jgi:hypothetical protein